MIEKKQSDGRHGVFFLIKMRIMSSQKKYIGYISLWLWGLDTQTKAHPAYDSTSSPIQVFLSDCYKVTPYII